jgi:hypothetical protein
MPNLSALVPLTTAATALSNLILVSPQSVVGYQPQNPPSSLGQPSTAQQPPAFLFNYEGEQSVTIESDITDHFVENNTAIQDQIALRPEIVTTHGFIGELTNIAPPALAAVKAIADKLVVVGAFTPVLSATALLAYAQAFQAYQVAINARDAAVSAFSSLTNTGNGQSVVGSNGLVTQPNQNKQQIAFQQFYGYWRNRTLFTVQTPWAVFLNMAIRSLRAIQGEDTRVITDFEISFKMIRTAQTVTVPIIRQNRLNSQSAGPTNLGTSTPVPSISLSTGLSANGLA